ncbi:IclR family transcriptional regulator [soil metagenome]
MIENDEVQVDLKRRAGIRSVEIGMRVLGALADLGGPSALAAVVRGCGLSPPQTHRYLVSLSQSGMVRQLASGAYDLGPAALKLGMRALARIDTFKIADEEIEAFCASTGATVLVAVLGPAGPTIVRWHVGSPPVVTSLAVGSVMSILHSATGQVFLSFRPERETEALVAAERAATPQSDPEQIQQLRHKVRSEGVATVGGTLIPGLNAKAFPILNLQGDAVLVATLVSTSHRSEPEFIEAGDKLRLVCNAISAIVGGRVPDPSTPGSVG